MADLSGTDKPQLVTLNNVLRTRFTAAAGVTLCDTTELKLTFFANETTMAYTETQLEALEAALAKGERRVTFGDKTIEYRSIEELRMAIREVQSGLFEQASQAGRWPRAPRQIRVTTGKGL